MDPEIEKLLFVAASGFPLSEERKAFLDYACKDDPAARRNMEDLFSLQTAADSFFDPQPEIQMCGEAAGDETIGAGIGRYHLIERIGAGGWGVVYLAEQQEPVKRKVALKVVRVGMDTESVMARFNLERQALALMDHPYIARVFDAGATGSGRPYFVMELVDGEKITDFCASEPDLRQRLELFLKVCQAIQHAHQKGVIHRDIKPSNVLVRVHDGVPVPKVIDFGIAKATGGEVEHGATFTLHEQVMGTPAYMSPEQALGSRDVDTRSDVYSLGVLLYELIVGRPPFDEKRLTAGGIEETRRILREEEPPLPSMATGDARVGDLDWVVLKAMEKDRGRRYETANGLAADVLRYLNNEPVTARAPTRRYRLGMLIRRNRMVFIAGGVAVFGLLAGFGVSTVLFIRERYALGELSRLHRVAEEARINETMLREGAEFRERVAQAAVLMGRGEMAGADELLAAVPIDRTPVSLEAVNCYRQVAEWHLLAGRLGPAADRYASEIHALANVDDSDSDRVSFDLLPAAAALCYSGNDEGYERFREFAIQRFSGTRNPQVAEQVLKASLLKPAREPLLRQLDPMAVLVESAIQSGDARLSGDPRLSAWFCFALGLKHFREGNDGKAGEWIGRCLSYPELNAAQVASSQCLLGMIESHRGNRSGARALIEFAREPLERSIEAGPSLGGGGQPFWFDWANVKVLQDEAFRTL